MWQQTDETKGERKLISH